MLATVKPRKWIPPGLNMKFIAVATSPTIVIAPNFLIQTAATVKTENPMRSHKKGKPNIRKKIGEKMEFKTPHRAAHMDISAISLLLK